jgi:hypothetical protein
MAEVDLATLASLPVPTTKADLLDRIANARPALEALIASLDDAALNRRDHADWRVRDHLSHISAWERMLIAHVTDGKDHKIVQLSPTEYAAADLQQINDRLHDLHKHDALADVRAEFAASHAAILALIDTLDAAALARPYWDDDPSKRPVIDKLTGDTYRHYLEPAHASPPSLSPETDT